MDLPKHRRLILLGIALVAGSASLVLSLPWTSSPDPIALPATTSTPQLPERELEPPRVEAAAPAPTAAPAESGTFRGRVLDAATRQPVPQFEVQLVGVPRGHIRGNEPRVAQTFESADGRFAWQRAPVGAWSVMVTAPGYQQFRFDGLSIVAGKTTRESVMPMRRGHTLKGRVFDQGSGAGIGDAWVAFRDASDPWPNTDPTRERSEKSKEDGTFVLDGVPGGEMIVMVGAKDHANRELAVVVSDDTPPMEIGLAAGAKIAGMVLGPDGTPAQKGHLMLAGPGIPFVKELDESGSFSFAHRPAGRYQLNARTPVGNAQLEVELAENEIREDLVLKVSEGRSVRGVIRGLRPEQLARTFISVRSVAKSASFTANPDAQGAYIVRGVPPGRAEIHVSANMSRHTTKSLDVPADKDAVLDIVFPLGGRLSGRVTQDGKAAADRNIWVGSAGGGSNDGYQARTNQDGRYEIEGVPPGEYRVSVGQDASRVVSMASDAVVNIDIPLVQLGGRVVEEGGTVPIVGAGVHLIGSESQTAHVRNYKEADDFGQFRLTGIEPGEIMLTVYKRGYEMYREKMVYSSPIKDKTITLRKSAGVEVTVQADGSGERARPLYVTEQMPGSNYGIGLWVPLDLEGVGHLPSALAGSTLRIQRQGSTPVVIEDWDGQSLNLKLQPAAAR